MSKAHILQAAREAKGDQSAELIGHLKKADMAREAERLMAGSGWLPEPLRMAAAVNFVESSDAGDGSAATGGGSGAETSELPEFLTEDPALSRETHANMDDVIDGEHLAAAE